MPDLPSKKVGIVACSGEELSEGTIARQGALRVLEESRPDKTATICLPLFLAGGEGDRAFARFYPTVTVDGCEKRCAARATEELSGKPAAEVVVTSLAAEAGFGALEGRRRLNEAGLQAVELVAQEVARQVDHLVGQHWDRKTGALTDEETADSDSSTGERSCACGSEVPVLEIDVDGERVALAALPLLLEKFKQEGRTPGIDTARDLLEEVAIYNDLPTSRNEALLHALESAYASYLLEGKE